MLGDLEALVGHFVRASPFDRSQLGRSESKFGSLTSLAKSLPSHCAACPEDVLFDHIRGLAASMAPYGRPAIPTHQDLPGSKAECEAPCRGKTVHPGYAPVRAELPKGMSCKPVVAERIKWTLGPTFDPTPYLTDPIVKSVFADPDSLRLSPELWPQLPRAKVHGGRAELLKLAAKWDAVQALRLVPVSEVDPSETVGAFCVPKNSSHDRLILNPTTINGRSQKYSNFTKLLTPGSIACSVHLEPHECLRICADDLSEMYYTFQVPYRRARRNTLSPVFQPHEVEHFKAFDPTRHNTPVHLALSSLAMGDCMAVEIAQQSHYNVLAHLASAVRPHEYASYRRPFPRHSTIELLAIDDHVTLQKLTRQELVRNVPARDTEIFAAAGAAYQTVQLVQHPDKRRRNETVGTFLGAELDGVRGFVSAPRHRLGALMLLTSIVCLRGSASPALLASLVGLWVHALMFRRPALALLSFAFEDARRTPANEVIGLARQTLCELQSLVWLAPLLVTNLRTDYIEQVFCTDASPFAAGICAAPLAKAAVKELWRHSEQRGFYTKLEEPATATLRELGLPTLPTFGVPGPCSLDSAFPARGSAQAGFQYDCLALFCRDDNWERSHRAAGLTFHPDVLREGRALCFEDLADDSTFHMLLDLARARAARDWHFSPPALSFVSVRRPRVRSKVCPFGYSPSSVRTALHNRLAQRLGFLINIVLSFGGFFSVVQPANSLMYNLHVFISTVCGGGVLTKLSCCAFGSAFAKPLVWLHNKPWIAELEGGCDCPHRGNHLQISGCFGRAKIEAFESRCRPGSLEVFGIAPRIGESCSRFGGRLPLPLLRRVASGAARVAQGLCQRMPLRLRFSTLGLLGFSTGIDSFSETFELEFRAFFDDPEWIGELADALPFKELVRYRFSKPGHVNVLEVRSYKTLLKWCARRHPISRFLGLFDSRVLLGAAATGRSSSPAITRILRSALPYVLGAQLYPGGLHVYSAKNRSDGPSRWKPVPGPSKELPLWLRDLCRGDSFRFDIACTAAQVPKLASRWLRLLLLLGGDIERNPGPQPVQRARRGPLDLWSGFASSTQQKMQKSLAAFQLWVEEKLGLQFEQAMCNPEAAALALRGYGFYLYEEGFPRYLLVYAITAVQDMYPAYRACLTPAWQIDKKWQAVEPGECRPVISQPIVCAMIAVALLWNWHDWAAVTIIGFLCMLHPAELVILTRGDLVFPRDALTSDRVAYVHIRNPKTARFARRQHCRLEDPVALLFLESLYSGLAWDERIFRGSPHVYRMQWNAVMSRLQVPHSLKEKGATPGVLRGSGATFLYLETEDLALVAWRGRWAKIKTVEFYLQEVAAQLLLQRLPAAARARIAVLRDASRMLLLHVASSASRSSAKDNRGG